MLDRTYRSVDSFESANLEQRKMQYLYSQEGHFYFMDLQSYDQSALSAEQVGDAKNYLIDNLEVDVLLFDGRPIDLTLPNFVDLLVTRADPWARAILSPVTANP